MLFNLLLMVCGNRSAWWAKVEQKLRRFVGMDHSDSFSEASYMDFSSGSSGWVSTLFTRTTLSDYSTPTDNTTVSASVWESSEQSFEPFECDCEESSVEASSLGTEEKKIYQNLTERLQEFERVKRLVQNMGKCLKYPYNPRRRRSLRYSRPGYPTKKRLQNAFRTYFSKQPAKPYDKSVYNPYGILYWPVEKD
ncbi:unnamed protein product [Bursaphelenchus okinawaensis]|uniref:Uncharacterized protein n=1 Tax=Bursaphelenchus okinawaensis TaxID=465554 RepID=A0A811K1I6_9BILA|nr:unnamed protein product [Bursaphelenchus okinawaensis]CAG9089069.1 unnamed protein product [Bursaphelenchus okinawaensis]